MTSVNLRALSASKAAPKVSVALDLANSSDGSTSRVSLGAQPLGVRSPPRATSRAVPCRHGCYLTGITITTAAGAKVSGSIVLADMSATTTGSQPTPVALGPTSNWRTLSGKSTDQMVPDAPSEDQLTIKFATAGTAVTTMRQAWLPTRVPTLIAGPIAGAAPAGNNNRDSDRDSPATVSVSGIDGVDRTAYVAGRVPRVPGAATGTKLVNLDVVSRASSVGIDDQIEVWAAQDGRSQLRRLTTALDKRGIDVGGTTTLSQTRRTLANSTAAWSLALGVVVGIIALLIGLLVVVILAMNTWRTRAHDLAALRMSGLRGSSLRTIATLAQLPVILLAVAAGTACGAVGGSLRAPRRAVVPLRSPRVDPRPLPALERDPHQRSSSDDPPARHRLAPRSQHRPPNRADPTARQHMTTPTDTAPAATTRHGLAVSTQGLVHIYHSEGHDVAALSGVALDVRPGELVGLLGPSGSGKSTLLSLLGGLFRPSAGRIRVGDVELSTVSPRELDDLRAREIALMLQGAARNLLPYFTPRQNVAFAQAAALRAGKDLPDPGEFLTDVGLGADEIDRPPSALTPGHLQLVAVAVAVATQPGVLLADEPTSQLDHEARDLVLQRIAWINRTLGTTVVLVTHDPEVAEMLPRTVTIRDGRVGGEGRLGEEYSVVTADGFLPLPMHARDDLPAGTLVRFHRVGDHYALLPEGDEPDPPGQQSGQQPGQQP